jgi:hypothetical protein
MSSKATRQRKEANKVKRYLKRIHGPNWQSKLSSPTSLIHMLPHDWERRIGPGLHYRPEFMDARPLSVPELRLKLKRAAGIVPGAAVTGYTEGVSPNA